MKLRYLTTNLPHLTQTAVNIAPAGKLDFALLVDGLAAEREQGITIVAYRYFSMISVISLSLTLQDEQYTGTWLLVFDSPCSCYYSGCS